MHKSVMAPPSIPPRSDAERELETVLDDAYESLDSLEEDVENIAEIARDALSPLKKGRDRPRT